MEYKTIFKIHCLYYMSRHSVYMYNKTYIQIQKSKNIL